MSLLYIPVILPLLYLYPKLLSLSLLTILCFHNFYWKRRNLPPGPIPLPLIGNVYSFYPLEQVMNKLVSYSKTYGPIHTFWMSETPFIFITDFDLMQKYFVKQGEHYADRKVNKDLLRDIRGGEYGIAIISGERWKEQRRFALHTLKDFGMGKNQMEERILTEVVTLFEKIDKSLESSNAEIDISSCTDIAVGSLINAIVCGYRYSIDGRDEEFFYHKKLTQRVVNSSVNPFVDLAFRNPWLMKIWPFNIAPLKTIAEFNEALEYIQAQIVRHQKECDYTEDFEPRDFMDVFLLEKARRERNGEDTSDRFNLKELQSVCIDLWMAGQETSSSALSWVFAYLVNHQEVQKKVHKELDEKVGDRLVVSSDKSDLHYLNAVIMECLRCSNMITLNIPHATNEEVNLEGYILPKETVVVPQVAVLFLDEKYFPDPYAFKPERFLDESGHFKNIDQFIPFSLGKRQCPGEGMARAEMFLFAANILNKYRLLPGEKLPTLKKLTQMSPAHAPYKARLEIR